MNIYRVIINSLVLLLVSYFVMSYYPTEINFSELEDLYKSNVNITNIDIDDNNNKAHIHTNVSTYLIRFSKHVNFEEKIAKIINNTNITYFETNYVLSLFGNFMIYSIMIMFLLILFKNMFIGSFSNIISNDDSQFMVIKETGIKFDDVVGLENAKTDLRECIKFFTNREKYIEAGFKIPKGLLFTGPPGTGKTFLAKAFAGEANITFIPTSGSDFMEIFVGVGSQRIKSLFNLARKNAPAVIFIDEIDSIGRKRSGKYFSGVNNEQGSTLNSLLTEMDGFKDTDNVMIIAATNIKQVLDKALTRSGRFDKNIVFDKPNIDEREKIFEINLNKIKLHDDFDKTNIRQLAKMTAGLTGADIANICNQSVLEFMKRDSDLVLDGVMYEDIEISIDNVAIGMEKRERKLDDKEKEMVAVHESGHTLLAYVLKHTTPPIKVSIIPRGDAALGFTQQEPVDKKLYTFDELYSQLVVLMGGRVAEQIKFNHISSGASDDLEKAYNVAYNMITKYGMIDDDIVIVSDNNSYSENTKMNIDNKVKKLLNDALNNAKDILIKNIKYVDNLSKYLLENEVILNNQLDDIIGNKNIINSK